MNGYHIEKLKNLINLRTNLITILVILIGGVYGLHLLNLSSFAYWISLIIGVFYILYFMKSILSTNDTIYNVLEELKNV